MQILFNTLELAFSIYLVWNGRLLLFLHKPPLDAVLASRFTFTFPKRYIKVSGMFFGYVDGNIIIDTPAIYGDIWLQPKPTTVLIPRLLKHGDQVMAYGKLRVVDGKTVLYPTKIICINNKDIITKSLNLRLTISTIIAILLEVIYYVIFL